MEVNLQLNKYQVSKEEVHEITFGDIAVIFKNTNICHMVTGILIPIGSLRCLKEAKKMIMVFDECQFHKRFPNFQ